MILKAAVGPNVRGLLASMLATLAFSLVYPQFHIDTHDFYMHCYNDHSPYKPNLMDCGVLFYLFFVCVPSVL